MRGSLTRVMLLCGKELINPDSYGIISARRKTKNERTDRMKKFVAGILILALALALCGCGKEAISAETFEERMDGMGLLVFRNEDEIDGTVVKDARFGGTEEEDPAVWFYEFDEKSTAEEAFNALTSNWDSLGGTTVKASSPGYGYYSIKNDTEMYIAAYVDNTFLFGGTTLGNAELLEEIFETMGYK